MKSKVLFTLFLGVLMATSSLLPYFCFYLQKVEIAQRARIALLSISSEEAFQTLYFTPEEFEHLDFELFNSNEFSWQGTMFDIIKVEHSDDKIKVVCFADEAESFQIKQLLRQIKSSLTTMDDLGNEKQVGMSWYCPSLKAFEIKCFSYDITTYTDFYTDFLPSGVIYLNKKPPQVEVS